jgi:hypothetical protein
MFDHRLPFFRKVLLILSVLSTLMTSGFAQKKAASYNKDYIETFEDHLTTRVYLAKKYTSFSMEADETSSLRYRPNSLVSMGINASYKALSLSIGSGFGFLNPNREEKGKTRSFDFQTHIYTRDWVTDIYAQLYKGYYLKQANFAGSNGKRYYVRPDIRVGLFGASIYRVLNGDEFSYRAGFLQNEWQKESAGSILIGGEIYYGTIRGDSALIPGYLSSFYPQRDINRVRVFEFGPGAGYAYTAVWQEHFFATGSLTVNADISVVNETSPSLSDGRTTITPNATFRAVAGYNSRQWAATIGWVHNSTNMKGPSSDQQYSIKTGSFSITLARRFLPGNKFKNRVEPILKHIP